MTTYSLTETSKITGVPSSSLRYYEDEKLLKNIERDNRNRRIYNEKDIELINLIKCFRLLGMHIGEIKKQIEENCSKNNVDTKKILEYHRNYLLEQRQFIDDNIKEITLKLKSLK